MKELTPQKQQARELILRELERNGLRWHMTNDEQWKLMEERRDLEDLWRLGGFGEPPEFHPTTPRVPVAA